MSDFLDDHIEEIMRNQLSPVEVIQREMEEEVRKQKVFSINKIIVSETCDDRILKILKPGEYVFTDSRYDNFFLEGVTVCSVVGKNGCGKSSLIELLFRMINNLGAVMLKDLDRPAAETLYFIDGVVADLYYSIGGVHGTLCCRRNSISLVHGIYSFDWNKENGEFHYTINGVQQQENNFVVARNVSNHFFYLVATNYSLQAYIDSDYKFERISSWQPKKNEYGEMQSIYEWHKEDTGSWINSVFHKNDGYMCPIVLNPYRHEGQIDMSKEAHLTTNRLCALLLQTQNDYQIIDGYRLAFVEYQFNQWYLLKKFDRQILRDIPTERVSDKFLYAYMLPNSYAKAILDGYGIDATKVMNYIELTLRLYLVYKTFSIANKYPQYSHFKPIGSVNNAFKSNSNQYELALAKELAEKIYQKGTHIELKVHQTIDLIRRLDNFEDKNVFERRMTYDEICSLLGINTQCESVMERFNTLPPPLFEPTIYLIKNDVYNSIIENEHEELARKEMISKHAITLSELSSGERQFIYTTSTLLYHAFNIQSIPQVERVAYRNLCFVLEEVEICFHPEYQRTFISSLLSLLARTELNKAFGICIVVVTHSPFVLSDIPASNILALDENGLPCEGIRSFGSNIHDMLKDSFFLKSGWIGDFAKDYIHSLIRDLEKENMTVEERLKLHRGIMRIDEPVMRTLLLEKYRVKYPEKMVSQRIEELKKELAELEKGAGHVETE